MGHLNSSKLFVITRGYPKMDGLLMKNTIEMDDLDY